MMRRALALAVAAALFMTGCASRADKDSAGRTTAAESSEPADGGTSGGDADQKFGSLDSPCGKGTAKVAAAEAGGSPDTLRIGIANDRNSTFRPGLNSFFWDSANAFVKWCNDQGGVAGVPLEAIDVDGKVLEVEAAVAKSCSETFALVGGGWTQDNLAFSGKDGADFHKCKLIAFAGFAVSSDFAEANGQVQPVPNTAHEKPDGWLLELAKLYPEGAKHLAVMYGTLPAIEMVADQVVGVAEATKKFGKVTKISYDALTPDFNLMATQVKDQKAGLVYYAGEEKNFAKFVQALDAADVDAVVFADANQYDAQVLEGIGATDRDVLVRIASHPYEEADEFPATQKLVDVMKQFNPEGRVTSLTAQSFSAMLLFAQSAKQCAEDSGEITRECVLAEGRKVTSWDGGGLHAEANPGENKPPTCSMFVGIKNGKWVRKFPELDSDADDGDGFSCTGELQTLSGDFGEGKVDPSRDDTVG